MNGLDFVTYTSPEKPDHIPYGQSKFRAMYAGYSFLFESEDNMHLFESEPQVFAPQYGGFCAWAVSGETDRSLHPWSADCLGPAGDPRHWQEIDGRLYFFRSESAQRSFLANTTRYIHAGDGRWEAWFERGRRSVPFATLCAAEMDARGRATVPIVAASSEGV
jgi:YHS domain-containing protein